MFKTTVQWIRTKIFSIVGWRCVLLFSVQSWNISCHHTFLWYLLNCLIFDWILFIESGSRVCELFFRFISCRCRPVFKMPFSSCLFLSSFFMFVHYVDVLFCSSHACRATNFLLPHCCYVDFTLFIDIVRQKRCWGSSAEVHGMVLGLVAQLQVDYLPHYECVCCWFNRTSVP